MDLSMIIFNSHLKLYITGFMVQDGGKSTVTWQCFEQFIEYLKRKLIWPWCWEYFPFGIYLAAKGYLYPFFPHITWFCSIVCHMINAVIGQFV